MTRGIHVRVAAVAVAALLATGVAFAQGPRAGGAGRGGPGGRMGGLPVAGLNLTQAQQDLVRDIVERGRESGSALQQKVREAQEAQRRVSGTFPISENAVRTAALALAEAQADLAVHQARVQNEVFNALTSEQQAEVRKRQAERDARQSRRGRL